MIECTNKRKKEMLIEVELNEVRRYQRVNKIDLKVIIVMDEYGLRFKNGHEFSDLEFIERVKKIE